MKLPLSDFQSIWNMNRCHHQDTGKNNARDQDGSMDILTPTWTHTVSTETLNREALTLAILLDLFACAISLQPPPPTQFRPLSAVQFLSPKARPALLLCKIIFTERRLGTCAAVFMKTRGSNSDRARCKEILKLDFEWIFNSHRFVNFLAGLVKCNFFLMKGGLIEEHNKLGVWLLWLNFIKTSLVKCWWVEIYKLFHFCYKRIYKL